MANETQGLAVIDAEQASIDYQKKQERELQKYTADAQKSVSFEQVASLLSGAGERHEEVVYWSIEDADVGDSIKGVVSGLRYEMMAQTSQEGEPILTKSGGQLHKQELVVYFSALDIAKQKIVPMCSRAIRLTHRIKSLIEQGIITPNTGVEVIYLGRKKNSTNGKTSARFDIITFS